MHEDDLFGVCARLSSIRQWISRKHIRVFYSECVFFYLFHVHRLHWLFERIIDNQQTAFIWKDREGRTRRVHGKGNNLFLDFGRAQIKEIDSRNDEKKTHTEYGLHLSIKRRHFTPVSQFDNKLFI